MLLEKLVFSAFHQNVYVQFTAVTNLALGGAKKLFYTGKDT